MVELIEAIHQAGLVRTHFTPLYEEQGKTVYCLKVPLPDALVYWQTLHDLSHATGYLPVIMGDSQQLERFNLMLDLYNRSADRYAMTIDAILARSLALDVDAWFARAITDQELKREDWSHLETVNQEVEWRLPMYYRDDLNIALTPTLHSWKLPAYLKFGNFNACPTPEVHVALCKRWDELMGLEVIHLSHDTIDARIIRPPTERELALRLAQEHFVYCGETASFGNTVERHAERLMQGQPWHFWWD
jgi:hypothetical protein